MPLYPPPGIAGTLVDAKGDLLVGTADDTVARKAVGATDGMVLRADSSKSDGLDWALPAIHAGYTTGRYYTSLVAGLGSSTLGGRLAPFYVTQKQTFDRIAVFCTVVAANSTARLGIFNDDGGGKPGTLVLDAGTVATAVGTGVKEIAISQALTPGLYWLACEPQGGTATLLINNNSSGLFPAIGYDAPANANVNGWSFSNGGAFTSSPTPSQSGTNFIVWLRAA